MMIMTLDYEPSFQQVHFSWKRLVSRGTTTEPQRRRKGRNWEVVPDVKETYRLRYLGDQPGTGNCADCPGEDPGSRQNLRVYQCVAIANQRWHLDRLHSSTRTR